MQRLWKGDFFAVPHGAVWTLKLRSAVLVLALGIGTPAMSQTSQNASVLRPSGQQEPDAIDSERGPLHTHQRKTAARTDQSSVGEQMTGSFDAGDYYVAAGSTQRLHRLAGAIALVVAQNKDRVLGDLTKPGGILDGYAVHAECAKGFVIMKGRGEDRRLHLRNKDTLKQVIVSVSRTIGVHQAVPVFTDPKSGYWCLVTDEIIVRLKPDTNHLLFFGAKWSNVRPLAGTTDQFIVRLPSNTTEDVLAQVNEWARDSRVQWAQPNFIREFMQHFTPNDTSFTSQWHFKNTGQGGGTPGADVSAVNAWDIQNGQDAVIAVIDDGTQTNHPDLSGNFPSNTNEPIDGVDNDSNGYVDDRNGWDFFDTNDDNDPRPAFSSENHGTATAGIATSVGNNSLGVAGMAYASRLMPIRVATYLGLIDADLAEALYYAGGRTRNGSGVWRGADVVSISLGGFDPTPAVNDALTWTTHNGRGGKGCPVFCSSGNSGSGWTMYTLSGFTAGTYTFRWEFIKNGNGSAGDDAAWLDVVRFPGGETERFEGTGLPSGWTTGGNGNWTSVQDGVGGNHSMTGWDGPNSRAMRSGTIGDNQLTFLQVQRTVSAGNLTFWCWTSSEQSMRGAWSGNSDYPLSPYYHYRRTQSIYLATDFGSTAKTITSLQLNLATTSAQTLDSLRVRMKHTTQSSFTSAVWDNTGWTTVYDGVNVPLTSAGRLTLTFATPFNYNGTDNVMIDYSVADATWGGPSDGYCSYCRDGTTYRTIRARTNTNYGHPSTWSGTTASPALSMYIPRIGSGDELRLRVIDTVNDTVYFGLSGVPHIATGISYPASHVDTIAVGASTDFDYRSDYGQYGTGLDFVAPSSGGASGVFTTDRTGVDGYNTTPGTVGDYCADFGGTSASCPLAAGIGALLISRNPDLTAAQVRAAMQSSCDKIGGVVYTDEWNTYYGYGRVNAHRALLAITNAWVDFAYSGLEWGTLTRPFNTLAEGVSFVVTGSVVHVKAGTTSAPNDVNKLLDVQAEGGDVTVGAP